MDLLKASIIVQFLILFSLFQSGDFGAAKKSYIVYLGSHSHGPEPTEADFAAATDSHYEFLGSFLGSREKAEESIFISYQKHINGFATMLEEEEAAKIAKHPGVVSVFLNKERKLHTTRTWSFMMLENGNGTIFSDSLWKKANFGENTIIGNLDTGVWPSSESFNDTGYGPIPSKWKGICQNVTEGFACNRKLIGARIFSKGREADYELNATQKTPFDYEGHGTHTLSTAGGNFVPDASILGAHLGTAKGGAPRARLAAYKVCWPTIWGGGCYDADIMDAIDAAIHDGVHVITASIGGDPSDYFLDGISIGAFHAVKNGIVFVASAGNSGPTPGTVSNVSPWIITVAASTLDRKFQALVKLKNGKVFKGTSLSPALKEKKLYPLISGYDARKPKLDNDTYALLCESNTLEPKKVKGKILVCLRGEAPRVGKGAVALMAGAVGMILCNDKDNGNDIVSDPHLLPASHVTYSDGLAIFAYLNSTKNPEATLPPPTGEINQKPAPVMAAFSSAGPNTVTPGILKPDITAPGVDVIAAYTALTSPSMMDLDHNVVSFNVMSGTSMSCPHVAGVAALLKTLHPDWSPAAIHSAIATSARTRDNNGEPMTDATTSKATPFQYGSGHIRPNRAMHPGLVYDLSTNDYLDFLCSLGYNETTVRLFSDKPYSCPTKNLTVLDLNYPSFTHPSLSGSATAVRTVRNVGAPAATYAARVVAPPGVAVSVEPTVLSFERRGEEKSFTVTLKDKGYGLKGYQFGRLVWSDGEHYVRSPIVVQTAS